MVYHYFNEKKGTTVAVIKGTKWDAVNLIVRRHPVLCQFKADLIDGKNMEIVKKFRLDKFVIPNTFSYTSRCHKEDTFNKEVGRQEADRVVFEKLNLSIEKAMCAWADDQLRMMQNNVFDGSMVIEGNDTECHCGEDCGNCGEECVCNK